MRTSFKAEKVSENPEYVGAVLEATIEAYMSIPLAVLVPITLIQCG